MVIVASGIARGHAHTMATELRKLVSILQLIG